MKCLPAKQNIYLVTINTELFRPKSFPQNRSRKQLARLKEALERKSGKHVKLDLQLTRAGGGALKWPENVMTIPLKAEWIICAAHWLQDPNLTERKPVNPWI
ncbi:MAG: hypothetical protein ACLUMK_02955 [Christensenellales bacterium]